MSTVEALFWIAVTVNFASVLFYMLSGVSAQAARRDWAKRAEYFDAVRVGSPTGIDLELATKEQLVVELLKRDGCFALACASPSPKGNGNVYVEAFFSGLSVEGAVELLGAAARVLEEKAS